MVCQPNTVFQGKIFVFPSLLCCPVITDILLFLNNALVTVNEKMKINSQSLITKLLLPNDINQKNYV